MELPGNTSSRIGTEGAASSDQPLDIFSLSHLEIILARYASTYRELLLGIDPSAMMRHALVLLDMKLGSASGSTASKQAKLAVGEDQNFSRLLIEQEGLFRSLPGLLGTNLRQWHDDLAGRGSAGGRAEAGPPVDWEALRSPLRVSEVDLWYRHPLSGEMSRLCPLDVGPLSQDDEDGGGPASSTRSASHVESTRRAGALRRARKNRTSN